MRINDEFHMFFCFRQPNDFRNNPARSYRIGHATSDDLVEWKRTDSTLRLDCSASGWDSEMLCYPHVFGMDGEIYMLYNGNNFGRRGFGVAQLIR
jgi:sucrose-6-phosphate hydrolase SacC (GH32 family)